jgi:hypothetical protein
MIKKLTLMVLLGTSLGAAAFAQTHTNGTNCVRNGFGTNTAPAAARAASLYSAVVAYDANLDAALDATEQTAIAQALAAGTINLFGDTNHIPSAAMSTNLAAHIAADFAVLAPFDADKDGQLDSTEQDALAQAISAGTVQLPLFGHGHQPGGPRSGMDALEQQLLATYDANGNGVLDDSEWATIEADIKSGKLTLPNQAPANRQPRRGFRR